MGTRVGFLRGMMCVGRSPFALRGKVSFLLREYRVYAGVPTLACPKRAPMHTKGNTEILLKTFPNNIFLEARERLHYFSLFTFAL